MHSTRMCINHCLLGVRTGKYIDEIILYSHVIKISQFISCTVLFYVLYNIHMYNGSLLDASRLCRVSYIVGNFIHKQKRKLPRREKIRSSCYQVRSKINYTCLKMALPCLIIQVLASNRK